MILISSLIALWLFFIATMKVVDDKKKLSELNLFEKVFVFLFVAYDVAFNYTGGAVMFWELASNDRKTLTARLKHVLHSGEYYENEWRFKLALFMCKYMIEPWDFNHCRLNR